MEKITYIIINEFQKNENPIPKDIKKIFNQKLFKVILSIEQNDINIAI